MSAYREVIKALNALQLPRRAFLTPGERLMAFETHVQASGLQPGDLDRLSVVHIAGTKGKGSCCAFVESILRNQGFKTGFFSSPHILSVRERFRINGVPVSEDRFVDLFWRLHERLCTFDVYATQGLQISEFKDASKLDMVRYFQFLTIMAFHLFLESKVDVAIIEVGVGGTYDSTNVIRNPVVCGITRLDYDHTNILGTTIEEIAWNKAGILKRGSIAVTVPQEEVAFKVIAQRAAEVECPLYVCPNWEDYTAPRNGAEKVVLGIAGKHQLENASLALQLARLWTFRTGNAKEESDSSEQKGPQTNPDNLLDVLQADRITNEEAIGLSRCFWPGRSQKIARNGMNFYLDGAHTPLSLQCCVDWFLGASKAVANSVRVLIFHCTKGRQAKQLLQPLIKCGFQYALFSPPSTASSGDPACGNLCAFALVKGLK